MKHFLWILALVLVGISYAKLNDEVLTAPKTQDGEIDVNALINRARWGDGRAFLQLADCYRDGKGVKQDFSGMMWMAVQANEYGCIKSVTDYILSMPADNEYRQLFEIFEINRSSMLEKRDSIEKVFSVKDNPNAYVVRGMLASEANDSAKAVSLLKEAEEKGSALATILLGSLYMENKSEEEIKKIESIAPSSPYAYVLLSNISIAKGDDRKRAEYLLKAEEYAMLGRRDARWLLDYCKKNNTVKFSDEDRRRIESLMGITR